MDFPTDHHWRSHKPSVGDHCSRAKQNNFHPINPCIHLKTITEFSFDNLLCFSYHSKKNANGRRTVKASSGSGNGNGSGNNAAHYTISSVFDEQTINVPLCWVFIMVIFMSGVLMLVYYFFNYLGKLYQVFCYFKNYLM